MFQIVINELLLTYLSDIIEPFIFQTTIFRLQSDPYPNWIRIHIENEWLRKTCFVFIVCVFMWRYLPIVISCCRSLIWVRTVPSSRLILPPTSLFPYRSGLPPNTYFFIIHLNVSALCFVCLKFCTRVTVEPSLFRIFGLFLRWCNIYCIIWGSIKMIFKSMVIIVTLT